MVEVLNKRSLSPSSTLPARNHIQQQRKQRKGTEVEQQLTFAFQHWKKLLASKRMKLAANVANQQQLIKPVNCVTLLTVLIRLLILQQTTKLLPSSECYCGAPRRRTDHVHSNTNHTEEHAIATVCQACEDSPNFSFPIFTSPFKFFQL